MSTRREFVKRIPYVAPAVLTLVAAPEYAKAGSVKADSLGGGKDKQPKDKGNSGKAKGKS